MRCSFICIIIFSGNYYDEADSLDGVMAIKPEVLGIDICSEIVIHGSVNSGGQIPYHLGNGLTPV